MASPTPDSPVAPAPETHSSDAVTQTLALIQPWIDYIPRQQRRLGVFIFLSLMLFLCAFVFVRIDTTRAELHHPVRIRVAVESPTGPAMVVGSATENYWDQLNDPRLFLLPQPGALAGFGDLPTPDFSTINASPVAQEWPAPAVPEDYRFAHPIALPLDERIDQSLQPGRQPFVYASKAPPSTGHTTWQIDDILGKRHPVNLPALPSPVSDTELNPTVLRVAVGPDGNVEHVLVDQSCDTMGSLSAQGLDQQAVLAAKKIHFQSVDQTGLVWGRLTVFWNYAPKPREEIVPTPPSGP